MREQQFNNDNRQVVNTIEESNKYNAPDARRLRVFADPLFIPATPSGGGIGKLAEALSTIKPALMDYAINKKADQITTDINTGKVAAQTGGEANGEYQQWGYDSVKAVNDWTDWNQKVIQDYQENFDKDNGNLEDFLNQQWSSHPFDGKSQIYLDKFSPLAQKTMQNLREAQGKYQIEKRDQDTDAEIVRMFKDDIQDVSRNGVPWDVTQYEIRRSGLKNLFPGKTNSEYDELALEAVTQTAKENLDESLFDVLKKDRADGTPGMYNIPKWRTKIDEVVHQIVSAKNEAYNHKEHEAEKSLKTAANQVESKVLLKLIDIQNLTDPQERQKALDEVVGGLTQATQAGLPIADGVINTVRTFSLGVDKKDETKAQQDNYTKLRISSPNPATISAAYHRGDISLQGFNTLMEKYETSQRHSETLSKQNTKPVTSRPEYRQATSDIRQWVGADPFNMTADGVESRKRADTIIGRMHDEIDDALDAGKSPKEAIAQARETAFRNIEALNWKDKTREQSEKKVDALALKRSNPVGYYSQNISEYTQDRQRKVLPNLTPAQQLQLDNQALIEAAKRAHPKK